MQLVGAGFFMTVRTTLSTNEMKVKFDKEN